MNFSYDGRKKDKKNNKNDYQLVVTQQQKLLLEYLVSLSKKKAFLN